jgi:hypothetical protein
MTPARRLPAAAVVAIALLIVTSAGLLLRNDTAAIVDRGRLPGPASSGIAEGVPVPEPPPPAGATISAQVVVYGSTPSGIVAAVSAARAGVSVIVVSPDDRVGGIMTSGLGHADANRTDLIGGLPREVFERIGRLEGGPLADAVTSGPGWNYEPHVAQAAFEELLGEARVRVYLNEHLDRTAPVPVASGRITSFRTTDGATVAGDVFIDASYEGDLMAAAGVPFAIGREAESTYGEALAGVRVEKGRPIATLVSGRDASGAVLPGAQVAAAIPGAADGLVQAPTYRLCVTDDPSNRIPFTEPVGYDPATYALFGEAIRKATAGVGRGTGTGLGSVLRLMPLPDRKRDLNNRGLFSTDIVDGDASWSTASDAQRATIAAADRDWEAGLIWYLRTSPHVPRGLRGSVGRWGLCADEFPQTGGWPPELYIREARRMIGDVVLTQRDVQTSVLKPGAIALGTYRIDAHFVRRLVGQDGFVHGDGELSAPTQPYQIPYRALVPPTGAVDNLLVSVTISASHVAWASIRTEPTLMAIGQAAGIAAAQAARDGVGVREVDVDTVRDALIDAGAILAAPPVRGPDGRLGSRHPGGR